MVSGIGRRMAEARDPARRLRITAAVAAVVAIGCIIVQLGTGQADAAQARGAQPSRAQPSRAQASPAQAGRAQPSRAHARGRPPLPGPRQGAVTKAAAVPLVLTADDHRLCPAAATACVDLARHITWLQAKGKTIFGPVQMEPGKPGGAHQTPRGTFHVSWKAGPAYVSNIYHEAMPWATFFAAGGIAFHGGSLTQWSHGCVHLTAGNAHYYQDHLPVGAEVVVF